MPPSLPEGCTGAVTWKDLTIVFDVEGNVFCHKDGKWHLKSTSGEVPNNIGAGIAVCNDTVYMMFGEFPTPFVEEIHALDLNSWKWTELNPTGLPPKKCCYMSTWIHNGKVYCFGGYSDFNRTYSNQLFCYNISSNSWTEISHLPSPAADFALATVEKTDLTVEMIEKYFQFSEDVVVEKTKRTKKPISEHFKWKH